MRLLQSMVRQLGGQVNDNEPVLGIHPLRRDLVEVSTSKAKYTAESVILCTGPWANKLLQPLGLHLPLKVTTIHFRENSKSFVMIVVLWSATVFV